MSTAIAVSGPPQSSSSCPFSPSASTSSNKLAVPSGCPFSSKAATNRARQPAPPRAPTDLPDLRRTPSADLLYLPPLLSLLPASTPPATPLRTENHQVGYTTSRLPTVDAASIALHHALHAFKPTTPNYAYDDYSEAFNFNELRLPEEMEREWYIVAFRSTRAADSPSQDLYEADRLAHEEAVSAGGLLAYWYGAPNSHGSNLATCIWMSRAHAVKATSGPKHVEAMRLAMAMYANYDLERYVLRKVNGETGVTVEQWLGGEVAFAESD
ncbi:hypothetical protein BCR35DRAFT_287766 [Leucosporidium creatinivorum]|uniref:Uncharacterized protein n=1 Tax=Leucosporidium creatinivorum TaxID=106004 RepID=A0A1Y2G2B5_9BASI|nr:hypothetical protein BCR35DRAFT_287766 [Leucosporidium creatinivorum]